MLLELALLVRSRRKGDSTPSSILFARATLSVSKMRIISRINLTFLTVIEFGHNDGSAGAVDNGRQCAVGDGYDTTAVVKTSTYVYVPQRLLISCS